MSIRARVSEVEESPNGQPGHVRYWIAVERDGEPALEPYPVDVDGARIELTPENEEALLRPIMQRLVAAVANPAAAKVRAVPSFTVEAEAETTR